MKVPAFCILSLDSTPLSRGPYFDFAPCRGFSTMVSVKVAVLPARIIGGSDFNPKSGNRMDSAILYFEPLDTNRLEKGCGDHLLLSQ